MDIEKLIAENGYLNDAVENLKSRLELNRKGEYCYPRGDVSGRDFYTLIPLDYITDDERELLETEIIEDLINYDFDLYDWNGETSDDIESELYDFLFWEILKSI